MDGVRAGIILLARNTMIMTLEKRKNHRCQNLIPICDCHQITSNDKQSWMMACCSLTPYHYGATSKAVPFNHTCLSITLMTMTGDTLISICIGHIEVGLVCKAWVTFALRLGYGGRTPPELTETCGGRRVSEVASGWPYAVWLSFMGRRGLRLIRAQSYNFFHF